MKQLIEFREDTKRNAVMTMWQNQHPLMYLWFTVMSISLGLVYFLLFTTF